ncbi:MAG: hypothetical protein COV66_02220 [Nitrospinae bacterium CG11_big_fil_rev_8_21_14_0_20_45_15]|nr:MAG: hypothetical protein COV66_02220 [Nitrospinae bacterium CG11_big_fil_rev_8_21_14_0_20_45_15]
MLHRLLIFLISCFFFGLLVPASSLAVELQPNSFHELLNTKRSLEKQFGLTGLECFPFIKKIDRDPSDLLQKCLQGARILEQALPQVQGSPYHTFGVSQEFLRTGGFQTALIPWDTSADTLIKFLNDRPSQEEQAEFIEKIVALKNKIISQLGIVNLYCNQQVSNTHCLQGYESLSEALASGETRFKRWRSVVLTPESSRLQDAYALSIGFSESPQVMHERLESDLNEIWDARRKMFETMEERFGETIRSRLGVVKLFCDLEVSNEECLRGAENIAVASADPVLQSQHWGELEIHRFNTLIRGDFDTTVRFDLAPEQIVKAFAKRPTKKKITEDQSLAIKLEGYTKNNNTKLRVVCDLEGLHADLCVKGFQNFIKFLKTNRDFCADLPWTELMFVDGQSLQRVNFALNSSSRQSYIYADANSSYEEFETYLMAFGRADNACGNQGL